MGRGASRHRHRRYNSVVWTSITLLQRWNNGGVLHRGPGKLNSHEQYSLQWHLKRVKDRHQCSGKRWWSIPDRRIRTDHIRLQEFGVVSFYPLRTHCRFDVYTTSMTLGRRGMNVVCALGSGVNLIVNESVKSCCWFNAFTEYKNLWNETKHFE